MFLFLGQCNIAKTDLVPIIVTHQDDLDMVYNACKFDWNVNCLPGCSVTSFELVENSIYSLLICSESGDFSNHAHRAREQQQNAAGIVSGLYLMYLSAHTKFRSFLGTSISGLLPW